VETAPGDVVDEREERDGRDLDADVVDVVKPSSQVRPADGHVARQLTHLLTYTNIYIHLFLFIHSFANLLEIMTIDSHVACERYHHGQPATRQPGNFPRNGWSRDWS